MNLRRRAYDFLELGSFGGRAGAVFEYVMIGLIVANVIAVTLETVDSFWQAYEIWFVWFDVISVAIFAVEYIARVWASAERQGEPGETAAAKRWRYLLSPLAIIDLVAILPSLFGAFTSVDLRALRIFRLLRLFKLVRYSPALSSLTRVIYIERRALLAAFIMMMGLMFFSATLAHLLEQEAQPEAFGSIPASLWWALATLTTVGYGDVVPVTSGGQILGGVVMIIGFAFYALPIGIIASGFSEEVHRREFVVPVRVVADFPIFKDLPIDAAKELATRVRTLSVAPGTVLTHKMDMHNGLYCVVAGEITAFYNHRAIPLRAGDFFGECGMINQNANQPSTIAHTRTKVMWLESVDFHMLLSIYPELIDGMVRYAKSRLAEFVEDGHLSGEDRTAMLDALDDWVRNA